jgi:cell division transport system ATP-binding protein
VKSVIEFKELEFAYNNQELIKGISYDMTPGEFTFLVGKSGSGKSTLMQLIYFNLLPTKGEITVGEISSRNVKHKDILKVRRKLGIIFQDFKLIRDRNVYENLAFILEVTGNNQKGIKKKVLEVLNEVGLVHKLKSKPDELSGGEIQRVGIARAIINNPMLILADEPTGNLDPENSVEILELLKRINAKGTAVLFATHNYELVKRGDGKILRLNNGKLEIFERPK